MKGLERLTEGARKAADQLCQGSESAWREAFGPALVFLSRVRPGATGEKIDLGLRIYARIHAGVSLPNPIPQGFWETPEGEMKLRKLHQAMFQKSKGGVDIV